MLKTGCFMWKTGWVSLCILDYPVCCFSASWCWLLEEKLIAKQLSSSVTYCLCAWPACGACLLQTFGLIFLSKSGAILVYKMRLPLFWKLLNFMPDLFHYFLSVFWRPHSCYVAYTCHLSSIVLFPNSSLCVLCLYLSCVLFSGLSAVLIPIQFLLTIALILEWSYLPLFLL